jgi:hypothetical protein
VSKPLPPAEAAPLVVPLRDALTVVAILVVLALAANLALYAYLSPQRAPLSGSPSPARGECVWEKGPGDEGPGEAGSSPFTSSTAERPADFIPARRSEMLP